MHIVRAINLAGFVDFRVCGERNVDKTTHLLYVVGVQFYSIYDKAMCGTTSLLKLGYAEPGTVILVVVEWSSLLPLLHSFPQCIAQI